MADQMKSPATVFVVLILASLSLAGTGFYYLQKEKAKSTALQQQVDDLLLKQRIMETKLEEHKKTIVDLEAKLKLSQAKIDTLSKTLEQETKDKETALSEVEALRADLEKQKSLRSDLEKKLGQTQKDAQKTEAQLKEVENKRTQLEAKLKEMENQVTKAQQGVELGTIVVGPEGAAGQAAGEAAAAQAKKLEGKVLVVNKEYNFAVIDMGTKSGVAVDDVFSVYHANKYLGDIKIAKVHDSMSAADFLSDTLKDQVSEGDKVVQKMK